MKTKIVDLPDDSKSQQTIMFYLTKEHSLAADFKLYSKTYHSNAEMKSHEAFNRDSDLQLLNSNGEKDVAWEMFLLFTVGFKGAVFYLVSSFLNSLGTKASEFLTSLTISIGLKLKDEDVIELMEGEEPIDKDIQNCADKCVGKIVKNSVTIRGKTNLTYEELIGFSKDFDQLVKTFGHSYYDNIEPST